MLEHRIPIAFAQHSCLFSFATRTMIHEFAEERQDDKYKSEGQTSRSASQEPQHDFHSSQPDSSNTSTVTTISQLSTDNSPSSVSAMSRPHHRPARSIVDIIVAVEQSRAQWPMHTSPDGTQLFSSSAPCCPSPLAQMASAPSNGAESLEQSRSTDSHASLPPPPYPSASRQEHHRYFYALRKATRSRKQALTVSTPAVAASSRSSSPSSSPPYPSHSRAHGRLVIQDATDPTCYMAMLAWQRPSSTQRTHRGYDQGLLHDLLDADDKDAETIFGDLDATRRLQHAEIMVCTKPN